MEPEEMSLPTCYETMNVPEIPRAATLWMSGNACPTPCSRQDIRCEGTQVASRDSLHYSGPDMPCLRMNKKWESIKIAVSKGSTRT